MAYGADRLHEQFSNYKDYIDRVEAERFAPVYKMLEEALIKIEKGRAPDTEELQVIRNFLKDNRDKDGIADETINVIDGYLEGRTRS